MNNISFESCEKHILFYHYDLQCEKKLLAEFGNRINTKRADATKKNYRRESPKKQIRIVSLLNSQIYVYIR